MKILILIDDWGYLLEDGEFIRAFNDVYSPSTLVEVIGAAPDNVVDESHLNVGWDLDLFDVDDTPQETWDLLWAHAIDAPAGELTRREISAAESGIGWFMVKLYNTVELEEFNRTVQEIAERTRQWPRAQYTEW